MANPIGCRFRGAGIPGTVLEVSIAPPEAQLVETSFFGVRGASVIYGETGGRTIVLRQRLWGASQFGTAQILAKYISVSLNRAMVSEPDGVLEILSGVNRGKYPNCHFRGAAEDPRAPIQQDVIGAVGGNFHCVVFLFFKQLLIE